MAILLITINPGLQISGVLPAGLVGAAYTATLRVRGGLQPYQISVVSALPDGLTWTDNGDGTLTISGTPTETFSGQIAVLARDALGKQVQRMLALVVIDQPPVLIPRILEDDTPRLLESGDPRYLE